MTAKLTDGAIHTMFDAPADDPVWSTHPVIQIGNIKDVVSSKTGQATERRRATVSDGSYSTQVMFATQLNGLVLDGSLTKNTVIRVDKMSCNFVQNKRLIVFMEVTVIEQAADRIGNPRSMDEIVKEKAQAETPYGGQPGESRRPPLAAPVAAPSHATSRVPPAPARHANNPIYPIEGLSPYQNKWTIKARVLNKSEMKTWSNQRGDGKLFNVTLMDETGEIRATAFNAAADELFEKLQEGKVYYISKARINVAKKKFSSLPNNEYEMSLEKNTEIDECTNPADLPMIKYNFVPLGQLESLQKDDLCDIIGVVKESGDLGTITTKATNRDVCKRDLTIVDRSGFSVRLTLWGKQAEQWATTEQPVLACKGLKVGDFQGRTLSVINSSTVTMNPDIEEAHVLRGWFDSRGSASDFKSYSGSSSGSVGGPINRSELRTLQSVKDEGLGQTDEKIDLFSSRGYVVFVKPDNVAYPGCPTCSKKLVEGGNGNAWRCEKCTKDVETPEYRYMLNMAVADHTGQAWLSGFNDAGLVVFGQTANTLIALRNEDDAKFQAAVRAANGKQYTFSCKAKQDTFNDTVRVRYGISKIQPIDFTAESLALIDQISSYK